ncbi:MAG: hypothetical protein A2Z34_04935 [Planctomycetes bacterium RBG_16_59_8]|nr:MAG: hypothetical protein A2Z34_04935 [Planctomycetes bacterium RBG_16_59_8]
MPSLVIKHLPEEIHRLLKENAAQHHRSMTQEAIVTLENALRKIRPIPDIQPYRGKVPLTDDILREAKNWGRA